MPYMCDCGIHELRRDFPFENGWKKAQKPSLWCVRTAHDLNAAGHSVSWEHSPPCSLLLSCLTFCLFNKVADSRSKPRRWRSNKCCLQLDLARLSFHGEASWHPFFLLVLPVGPRERLGQASLGWASWSSQSHYNNYHRGTRARLLWHGKKCANGFPKAIMVLLYLVFGCILFFMFREYRQAHSKSSLWKLSFIYFQGLERWLSG